MPAGWRDAEFMRALRLDKKRAGDQVEFVLLDRLGHALTRKLSFDEILAAPRLAIRRPIRKPHSRASGSPLAFH